LLASPPPHAPSKAQRPGTLVFEAVRAQELRKANHSRLLRAVDPSAAP
jgi:hypothetical protein